MLNHDDDDFDDDAKNWITTSHSMNLDWLESVQLVFDYFCERTPRSFVETRETSLVRATWSIHSARRLRSLNVFPIFVAGVGVFSRVGWEHTQSTPRAHPGVTREHGTLSHTYAGDVELWWQVWNYKYADPDFGMIQARDLLQHLVTGPISNSPVDVVQGSRSVEVSHSWLQLVAPFARTVMHTGVSATACCEGWWGCRRSRRGLLL